MENRKEKLLEVMKTLNKNMGSEMLKYGSEESPKTSLLYGIPQIDTFCGGIVQGCFSVIYGGQSTGKSTLAYQAIGYNQKLGKTCVYIDMEHTFNPERAEQMGVNLQELILVSNSENAETSMDIIIALAKSKTVDLIILDSIQAMSPEGEQETKKGVDLSVSQDSIALLARKMSQFFRMCSSHVYKANIAVLLIGQVRTGGLGSFFVHDVLSGGKALHHFAVSVTNIRKGQGSDAPVTKVKEVVVDPDGKEHKTSKDVKIGHDTVLKIEKTKVTGSQPEGSELHLPFYFNSGFKTPCLTETNTAPNITQASVIASVETSMAVEGVTVVLTPGDPASGIIIETKPKKGRQSKK